MVSDSKHKHQSNDVQNAVKVTNNYQQPAFYRGFFSKIRSASPLMFLSGITQFAIGFTVVLLTILGHIVPLWLASVMSVFGSVSTMIGTYTLYEIFSEKNEIDNLYKEAIKRVINSQN